MHALTTAIDSMAEELASDSQVCWPSPTTGPPTGYDAMLGSNGENRGTM
jgi:hypothetical protein